MIKNKFSKILLASVTSLFFAPLYSFGFWYIGLGIGLIALGNGGQNYAAWAIMIGLPFLLMIICTFIQFKILNFLLKVEKWKIILWMILPFLLIPLIGPIIAQNELNKSHKYVEEWSKKAHAPDEFAKTIKPKITIASYTFSKNGTDVNEIKLMGSIVAEKNATVQIWATLLGETDSVISNGSSTVNITTIPSNFEVIIANDDRTKIAGFQFYDKLKIELLYIGNPDDYGPEAQLEHVIVRNLQDSGQSGIKFLPFSNYDTDHRTLLYSLDLQ